MRVLLAGYNLDADVIKELKQKAAWDEDNLTPETLSAAYARISRDPRNIDLLRQESRHEVEKSRKSNSTIIFGLGHASVAEHAYFNFDILGISRLAVEEVQKYRMASFTEKSQRYITLNDDFVLPKEIVDAGLSKEFTEMIEFQNKKYHLIYTNLKQYLFDKHADLLETKNGERTVDGWAKEDARYVVSLATESQFGMSVNARSLENMLRGFNSSKLAEVRELGQKLYAAVASFAPSIIKYTKPTPYDVVNPKELAACVQELLKNCTFTHSESPLVTLESYNENSELHICAAIIAKIQNVSFVQAKEAASKLSQDQKVKLFKTALSHREFYDSVSRYFEMADYTFELTVSASNYAQLKRHRISTQILGDYQPQLGVTVPPNIVAIGLEAEFMEVMSKTDVVYRLIQEKLPDYAEYILTNAHRRRVIFKANLRELYHFVSLRLDAHAQWDIQKTARHISELIKQKTPLAGMLLCGKNEFEETKAKYLN